MPKAPITYRETFFSICRGPRQNNDSFGHMPKKQIEWNVVETELGTMVESRTSTNTADAVGKIVNPDATDMSFSKISMMDEGDFYNQYGTGGGGFFDYNA